MVLHARHALVAPVAFAAFAGLAASTAGCRRAPESQTPGAHAPGARAAGAETKGATAASAPPPPKPKLVALERETAVRESSGLVLARVGGAVRAFVADEDDAAIVEIDVTSMKVARATPLGSRPRDLIVLRDGKLAVTLPDANAVVVLGREEGGALREERRVATPLQPMAMGLTPDDDELFVTTAASHTLVRYAAATFEERGRWSTGREPRAVLVANDGKRAFVSHAADGVVSIAPLDGGDVVRRDIGTGTFCSDLGPCIPRKHARNAQALVRIGERGVIVPVAQTLPNPPKVAEMTPMPMPMKPMVNGNSSFDGFSLDDGPKARPSAPSTSGYGMGDPQVGKPVIMDLVTIDSADGKNVTNMQSRRDGTTCLLPRAAVSAGDRVYVACLGSARIEQFQNPHGGSSAAQLETSVAVPSGPSALAVERDEKRMLVWSSFARTLSQVDLDAVAQPPPMPTKTGFVPQSTKDRLARASSANVVIARAVERTPEWLHGRELFFTNEDKHVSVDNRACGTCHVDGLDDGLTWDTPTGPRRTRTLAGELEKAPYGWMGDHATLEAHVKVTFKQLGGKGLPDADRDALLVYVRSLPKPPVHDDAAVARGKEIFAAADCASCHEGGSSDRVVHDVGTGARFMTPTLRGISMRSQLMHDGRYANLDALLVGAKKMGGGSSLDPDDRKALVAYLETL